MAGEWGGGGVAGELGAGGVTEGIEGGCGLVLRTWVWEANYSVRIVSSIAVTFPPHT